MVVFLHFVFVFIVAIAAELQLSKSTCIMLIEWPGKFFQKGAVLQLLCGKIFGYLKIGAISWEHQCFRIIGELYA
jgi:hypothetical protein